MYFSSSKLQKKFDMQKQEINQYYISIEKIENLQEITDYQSKENIIRQKITLDTFLPDYSNALCDAFANCVKHHQMILEFSKMFEEFYYIYLLTKLFYASFLICILAFTASIVSIYHQY